MHFCTAGVTAARTASIVSLRNSGGGASFARIVPSSRWTYAFLIGSILSLVNLVAAAGLRRLRTRRAVGDARANRR